MSRTWLHIIKDHQQLFFAYVMLVFVLFDPCPIKASIKNMIGVPVNTAQSVPKSSHVFQVNGAGKCPAGETVAAKIIQTHSSGTDCLLPAVFFTLIFVYRLGYLVANDGPQANFKRLKIPRVPIFLRYRRLII